MIEICLIADADYHRDDILGQTPGQTGIVNDCRFLLFDQHSMHEMPDEADALVVLNAPHTDLKIRVRTDLTFLISQEPPTERYLWHKNSFRFFANVYTQWPSKWRNVTPSHGFLSWYIDRDFDFLRDVEILPKDRSSTGIAYLGNKDSTLPGQVWRSQFVDELEKHFSKQGGISVDLMGRAYDRPVENKYDALCAYKYVLAIENTIVDHYWTEKLSDIFLAGALPLYVGPKNILDYFPQDSIVSLRPGEISDNVKIIEQALLDNEYEKRIEAVKIARNKVLTEYNLFYRISEIVKNKMSDGKERKKKLIRIPQNYWRTKFSFKNRIINKLNRMY